MSVDRLDRRQFLRLSALAGGAAVFGLPLFGCSSGGIAKGSIQEQEYIIRERGLSGDLPLTDLRGETQGYQTSGVIGGGILFMEGAYKGSKAQMVRFSWQTRAPIPEEIRSTLPETLVTFPATNQEDPSVEFVFEFPEAGHGYPAMNSLNPSDFLDPNSPANQGRVRLIVARLKFSDETYYKWTGRIRR